MLTLCRRSWLLHSPPQLSQLRTLRTNPRNLPSYIRNKYPSDQPVHRVRDIRLRSRRNHDHDKNTHTSVPLVEHDDAARLDVLRRLRFLLVTAHGQSCRNQDVRAFIWKTYSQAKSLHPMLDFQLSQGDLELIQASEAIEHDAGAQQSLDLSQANRWCQQLEHTCFQGEELTAVADWRADPLDLKGKSGDDNAKYLETGARLYAFAGDLTRARRHMKRLFNLHPNWNTSIMMLVFRMHTRVSGAKPHSFARTIYHQMKARMGADMTIEDYEGCLSGFVEAGQLKHAKEVFRDMVKASHLDMAQSVKHINKILEMINMLYRVAVDIDKMTTVALDIVPILPTAYHGHVFGDWMKHAVVQNAPEAAAQVLDMMMKQGYEVETFHLNMLLRALFRSKQDPNVLKAENIAWSMVGETRNGVRQHRTPDPLPEQIYKRIVTGEQLGSHSASLRPANATTFALLMQHHSSKLQWDYVDYLWRQVRETGTEINCTMMNVLIDQKCRKGAYTEAWCIYQQMTQHHQDGSTEDIFPNGATIRHLWKTLRLALGEYSNRGNPDLPTPRDLLNETVDWWLRCRNRADADRFKMGLVGSDGGAITALILHCFSYTQDLAGSLVSLHVLRQHFNIFPNEKVIEILHRQMAWIDLSRDTETVRSQYFHSRSNMRLLASVSNVYRIVTDRRTEELVQKGWDPEKLSAEQIGDMRLNMLSEFVRVILMKKYAPEMVEMMIEAAKRSIGVPDLSTGDGNAYEINAGRRSRSVL